MQRDVSPVGASRFERPYEAPVIVRAVSVKRSKNSSKDTSPTSPTSEQSTSSRPSHASTMQTNGTTTTHTAASSLDSTRFTPPSLTHDHDDADSPSCSLPPSEAVDADEWLSRFRSDPDLALSVSDECPDRATLAAVYDLPIFAADGTSRPFGSLYDPAYSLHTRQLVLFVRHFYCGACQAYLQCLAKSITKEDYFSIPIPTSIIVIGCGKPDLIPQYKKFTGCPFPIFADPTRQLFKKLGMVISANIGMQRPQYMKDISAAAWGTGQIKQMRAAVRDPDGVRLRDLVRGGNPLQIGGEFLLEDGEVVWCHRMRNYRNHAEVSVLRKLLELDE
ncbi:hypothetical protein LTR62_000515 [Meristemomyces frigidus]|uniref:Uncharacterized protein n=1 Tax=Meristemomyces frigidus TaxID=1508187 RepID=A0AAN7TAD5_9PEZI|nr:hypothetical protein LTR62_000515 [Meristemomyces frigidus]